MLYVHAYYYSETNSNTSVGLRCVQHKTMLRETKSDKFMYSSTRYSHNNTHSMERDEVSAYWCIHRVAYCRSQAIQCVSLLLNQLRSNTQLANNFIIFIALSSCALVCQSFSWMCVIERHVRFYYLKISILNVTVHIHNVQSSDVLPRYEQQNCNFAIYLMVPLVILM